MKLLIIVGRPRGSEIRIEKFREHLPKHGWNTITLDKTNSPSLEPPRGRGKLNEAFRIAFLEDATIIWGITSKAKALTIIKDEKPDAILASCPPFSVAILAAILKKHHPKIPLVIDYRDPWSFNQARGWESPIHRKATLIEERWADGKADRILQVGQTYVEKYLEEIPRTPTEKVIEIPNGYNPEEYENLKPRQYDKFTIGWIGTLWGDKDLTFLRAYTTMCQNDNRFKEETQLEIAGQIFTTIKKEILRIVQNSPIHIHGLLPRREALEITAGCHLLVYCGIEKIGKLDLASRIYEYAAIGQNTAAVSHPEGELANVLKSTKAGQVIPFENQRLELTRTYHDLWQKWRNGEDTRAKKDPEAVKRYSRPEAIRKLALILTTAIPRHRPPLPHHT